MRESMEASLKFATTPEALNHIHAMQLPHFSFANAIQHLENSLYLMYGLSFSSLSPAASSISGCLQNAILRNLLPISHISGG